MTLLAAALMTGLVRAGEPRLLRPFEPDDALGSAVQRCELLPHVQRVTALLGAIPAEFAGRGMLPVVRWCFAEPWSLPEIEALLARRAASAQLPAQGVADFAAMALGVRGSDVPPGSQLRVAEPQHAVFAMDFLLNMPVLALKEALAACPQDAIAPERVMRLLDAALESTSRDMPRSDALIPTLRAAAALNRKALSDIAAHFAVTIKDECDWAHADLEDLPPELAGAVTGRIHTAQQVPELGWIVVGTTDNNTYDMSRIAAVFDPGGNDTYAWSAPAVGSHAIVDLAGDDTYKGTGYGGPAGAILGVSLVMDLAGNDTYQGQALCMGAAAFGVGVLIDHAGNDTYSAERWSIGSALAGVGAVVDLSGTDMYDSPLLSQGVGGPSGVGLLLDAQGDDRYRADRAQPSVYQTPATFTSFSQGCAFGYRIGGAGGVGALIDAAGNDRYECGEFGQGCGYYLGLGMLADAKGDDLYIGNRYAQGTAAHQAFGILDDASGDDIYAAVTAADQGGAWDMSAAMLIDRAGNDTYRGGSLSQGAAAQQAIGVLLDMAGDDRYSALGASQGEADGNQYHWETTLCPSFALLWDRAGRNAFSGKRSDGQEERTGTQALPDGAEGRTQWGLFMAPSAGRTLAP